MQHILAKSTEDRWFQIGFGIFATAMIVVTALAASYSVSSGLLMLITLVILVPLGFWYISDPRVGLAFVILSVIPGNLIRLSLGTDVRGGAAITMSDIAIPLLILVWVIRKLVKDKKFVSTPVHAPLIAFTLIALISFVQGIFILDRVGEIELRELIVAFLYWGRWVEYACIFFIAADLIRTTQDINRFLRILIFGAVVVAIGGFFQIVLFPDFTPFAIKYGWDPHQDRLLSSFFDPNFVGGFMALMLSTLIGIFFYTPIPRKKAIYVLLGAVLGIALMLTFSRSGYLALLVSGLVIGLLRSRVSLVFGLILIIATFILVPRTFSRVTEGLSVDETGVKRIESWGKALSIIPMFPLLGTGYNMLASVQDDLGTVDEFDVNNRSGVENSFLTVFVTTGIVGLTAFSYMYFAILRSLYRNWKNKALPDRWRGLNLGVFAGILGLMFHSIFIHSLMYPFILIYLWMLIALALNSAKLSTNDVYRLPSND